MRSQALHGLLLLLALLSSCHGATVLISPLPGGTSHALQGLAIAKSLRQRGHKVVLFLPDADLEVLLGKRLVADVEPVVWQGPANSAQKMESLLLVYQQRPNEVGMLCSSLAGPSSRHQAVWWRRCRRCGARPPLLACLQACSQPPPPPAHALSSPLQFMNHTITHYEEQCRALLSDGAALDRLHQLRPDLLLADNSFGCNFLLAGAGTQALLSAGHRMVHGTADGVVS